MKGRRVYANAEGYRDGPMEPGDYFYWERINRWLVKAPNGHEGTISPNVHVVEEHDDGTITLTPSLVLNAADGRELYHGFLRRGEWTDA